MHVDSSHLRLAAMRWLSMMTYAFAAVFLAGAAPIARSMPIHASAQSMAEPRAVDSIVAGRQRLRTMSRRKAATNVPAFYQVEPLGDPSFTDVNVMGMNNDGDLVGQVLSARTGAYQAFRWHDGAFTLLQPLPGAPTAGYPDSANSINDHGDIVGYSQFSPDPLCCSNEEAVLWKAGSNEATPLGFLRDFGNRTSPHYWSQSNANAINYAGDVVGWSAVGKGGPADAFFKSPGEKPYDIENPGPDPQVQDSAVALAVNDLNQVLVTAYYAGRARAELLGGSRRRVLPFRALQYGRQPLNDKGVVVGTTRTPACTSQRICVHGQAAYTWTGTDIVRLQPLPGFTNAGAYGVNDYGDISGTSYNPHIHESRATLWPDAVRPAGALSDAQPIDLNSLIPSNLGITLTGAGLIDNNLQIVTSYRERGRSGLAFLSGSELAVTGVSPNEGPVKGGNSIEVTGHGFKSATGFCFATKPIQGQYRLLCTKQFKAVSDSKATLKVPNPFALLKDTGFRNAPFDVRAEVETRDTTYVSKTTPADEYSFVLRLDDVVPREVPIKGGNFSVLLSGVGFSSLSRVCFGTFAPDPDPLNFCTRSWYRSAEPDAAISVAVPDGFPLMRSTGYTRQTFDIQLQVDEPGNVTIETGLGPSDQYTYTIGLDAVTPNSGPRSGGNEITLQGVGLDSLGKVCFGTSATDPHPFDVCTKKFTIESHDLATVVVPDGSALVKHLGQKTVHVVLEVAETGYQTLASMPSPQDRYTYK